MWDGARFYEGGLNLAKSIREPETCVTAILVLLASAFGHAEDRVDGSVRWLLEPDPANPGGDMTPDQARTMLETTLREIVPDADLSTLAPGADLRNAFELDSLDFVELVDRLSTRAGFRIEEDDADGLRSVEAVTQFLVTRSDHVGQQA